MSLIRKYALNLVLMGLLSGGVFVTLQLPFKFINQGPRTDFDILWNAGQRFASGESVYQASDTYEHPKPPLLSPILAVASQIPRSFAVTFWNALNILLPLLILLYWRATHLSLRTPLFWPAAGGALILLRADWREEILQGQYNLFLLAGLCVSHFLAKKNQNLASGALTILGVLLKPSHLFVLPWVAPLEWRRLLRWIGGGAAALLILALVYVGMRSSTQLIADHQEWLRFVREVSLPRHILRTDNFGIPAWMNRLGIAWPTSSITILFSVGVLYLLQRRFRLEDRVFFHTLGWAGLALSPLTWRQNFNILLLLGFDLIWCALTHPRAQSRSWAGLGVLALLTARSLNPGWIGPEFSHYWGMYTLPLWLTGIATLIVTQILKPEPLPASKTGL